MECIVIKHNHKLLTQGSLVKYSTEQVVKEGFINDFSFCRKKVKIRRISGIIEEIVMSNVE